MVASGFLALAGSGLTRLGLVDDRTPKILMYHSIGVPGGYDNLPPAVFRQQLEWLEERYSIVPLDRLVRECRSSEKRIALTFDDGLESFREHALPILREEDIPATVYALGGVVDESVDMERIRRERLRTPDAPMDQAALSELVGEPLVTIGAHTRTHPQLPEVADRATLLSEIVGAKEALEPALGITIEHFAYPYNDWDRRAHQIVADTYETAVQDGGERAFITPVTDRHLLPRVSGCASRDELRWALSDLATYARIGASELVTPPGRRVR